MQAEPLPMNEAQVTTRNVSAVALFRIAEYPFLALFVLLVPRAMGPQDFGLYSTLIALVTIAGSVIELGMTEIFGRFIPEFLVRGEQAQVRRLYAQILGMKWLISFVAAAVLYGIMIALYHDRFPQEYYILLVAILLIRDWQAAPFGLLFGMNAMAQFTVQFPVRRILSLVGILFFYHQFGVAGALLSTLVIESVIGVVGFLWARQGLALADMRVEPSFLRPYLRFGFTLYLAWVLLNVWQQLGNVLIDSITKNTAQVALFSIPNQIFQVTANFVIFLMATLVPIFTQLLVTGKEATMTRWALLITKYTSVFCTLTVGGFVLAGPQALHIISPAYDAAYPNTVVLLLGLFPMILVQLGAVFATVYKQPARYFQSLCCAVAAFAVAAFALIPAFAAFGGALAMLISVWAMALAMFLFFRERLLNCSLVVLKTALPGFICLPLLVFQQSAAGQYGSGGGVWAGLHWAALCHWYAALARIQRNSAGIA